VKRQRARQTQEERDVDRLRMGRPLSPETLQRTREIAARQMDNDAYDVLRTATFVPDAPEEKPDQEKEPADG
jgi:hypothetical protein